MDYDLIYPSKERVIHEAPCVIATSYFYPEELIKLGVDRDAFEVNEPFIDDNEFEKVFKLWESPKYLRQFFAENKNHFEQEYWNNITEAQFVGDVIKSLNKIKSNLLELFKTHTFHTVVEPLDPIEEDLRLYQSIRIKVKQGWIHNRMAFRFYAIEIEENKCYLITGATIKIHKDMLKAKNTSIEMAKLEYAHRELASKGIDTKTLFIDFLL